MLAAEPVEHFGERPAPDPARRAAQPEIPILETLAQALVEAVDRVEHGAPDQRASRHAVLVEKRGAALETALPAIALRAEAHRPAVDEAPLGMGEQRPETLLERRRFEQIVLVEDVDECARGRVESRVARGAAAAVPVVSDHAHARVARGHFVEKSERPRIARRVVDQDPFEALQRLPEHAVGRFGELGARVVERRHDRDGGRRRSRRRVAEARTPGIDRRRLGIVRRGTQRTPLGWPTRGSMPSFSSSGRASAGGAPSEGRAAKRHASSQAATLPSVGARKLAIKRRAGRCAASKSDPAW